MKKVTIELDEQQVNTLMQAILDGLQTRLGMPLFATIKKQLDEREQRPPLAAVEPVEKIEL